MKNVIITGATGFIGQWLVKEMTNNKIKVYALVRHKSDAPCLCNEFVNQIVYDSQEYLDLQNKDDNAIEIDAFYHLAWGGVSTEQKNNTEIQMKNIELSLKMLELASELKAERFIATGTVAEYSFCESIMDVNARQTPNDMYGAAKTATHYLLETKARILGIPFNWVVIPSTFGEGRKDTNIITYTIQTLLKGEKPSFGYLTQMWDFLYVSEVARALRMIGESGHTGKTYAVGSGIFKPLREYIEIIRDLIDPSLELGIGDIPSYSDKVFSSCVSIYDLTKDTGFVPTVSFEEGISRTIVYFSGLNEK